MVKKKSNEKFKSFEVKVDGLHCSSCEILLERKLKKVKGVSKVDVDYVKGICKVYYLKDKPSLVLINKVIEENGYCVLDKNSVGVKKNSTRDYFEIGGIFVLLFGLFLFLGQFELFDGVGVEDNMGFWFAFFIGLVASFSSCLAVTGGLLVSISANYSKLHPNLSGIKKFKPHIYFNLGRLIGYTFLGALVGFFGSLITISNFVTGILTILASLIMILLGLQLLNIYPKFLMFLKPKVLKFLSHKIVGSSENVSKGTPFILGALTFFLPCGFTQALQLYVLSQGSVFLGAFIMFAFALGTLPGLLSLGALSSFLKGKVKNYFFKIVGVLVVILAFFTIPSALNLMGLGGVFDNDEAQNDNVINDNLSDGGFSSVSQNDFGEIKSLDSNVIIENGVQIIDMKIIRYDYYPSKFKIYKDMPVEWRIDASKAGGCARIMTVPKLNIFERLSASKINKIEFVAGEVGDLEFMCGMAMTTYGAKFEVVER